MKRLFSPQLLLIAIIILGFILRFYQLDRIPNGFVPEEVSNGWNAYSILKTGRDEWGKWFPLVFKETGGYKLALNSYLIVPFMAILGPSEFAVRIPTALASVLTVWLTYIFAYQLFKKQKIALAASLFVAVSPWTVAMARYGEDVNWGIALFLLGVIGFLKSLENKNWLIISGIAFALTFYTYAAYTGFTLLFVFSLIMWQWRHFFEKTNWKWGIVFLLIPILFLLPYLKEQNLATRFSQTTSTKNIGVINQINEHRTACLSVYPHIICRGVYNKTTARIIELGKNYVNHFSTTTYFLNGSKLGLSGMPDNWGFLYLFEFPLIILGIVTLIKRKLFSRVLIFWLILFSIPSALVSDGHIWRMMTIVPVPQILAAVGLIELMSMLPFIWIRLSLSLAIAAFVMFFWADYTSFFPYTQSANAYFGFRDVYATLTPIESEYDQIIIAPTTLNFEQLYIYYLFYMHPDPRIYQTGEDIDRSVKSEGWVKVARIGKWYFDQDPRTVPLIGKRILLVTDGTFFDHANLGESYVPILKHTIEFVNQTPAFKIYEVQRNVSVTNAI